VDFNPQNAHEVVGILAEYGQTKSRGVDVRQGGLSGVIDFFDSSYQ